MCVKWFSTVYYSYRREIRCAKPGFSCQRPWKKWKFRKIPAQPLRSKSVPYGIIIFEFGVKFWYVLLFLEQCIRPVADLNFFSLSLVLIIDIMLSMSRSIELAATYIDISALPDDIFAGEDLLDDDALPSIRRIKLARSSHTKLYTFLL